MKPSPLKVWKLPPSLIDFDVLEPDFLDWLDRKARAHVIRDIARGRDVTVPKYKQAIRATTSTPVRNWVWGSIRKWNNKEAKLGHGEYRKTFWNLPTVDHYHDEAGLPVFRLCSWRMNDAKNDQTLLEFLELAAKVQKHRGKKKP